jgi:hypothetical protein
MQTTQNQMMSIIQGIQKDVNEMYTDWKAAGGFGGRHTENDTKWIEVSSNIINYFNEYTKYMLLFHNTIEYG